MRSLRFILWALTLLTAAAADLAAAPMTLGLNKAFVNQIKEVCA